MSSSTPDVLDERRKAALEGEGAGEDPTGAERTRPEDGVARGERLAELLSVIADAPDFATAATFLVAQVADIAGARRGVVLALDPAHETLRVAATVGFDAERPPALEVRLDDRRHPLALAARSLHPVESCETESGLVLPFAAWVAMPFPQPQFRGAPPLLSDRELGGLELTGFTVRFGAARERRRRFGHAPFGVVLLEGRFSDEVLITVSHAAALAGPVLSRMAAIEEYRRSAERLDQQRDLLSGIINSLPDPIIITDATSNIVVQNQRAENLLSTREHDSEGRRRAVEINNLLFTSHLAKAAMADAGAAGGGSRELNMVDPAEGTDLLFEVLTHELPREDDSRPPALLSILRDVTDLRGVASELERQVQRARVAERDATRERDRLDLILENVADPILVTDDRSNIILMNRQAEQLFAFDAAPEPAVRGQSSAAAVRANDMRFTGFISDFTLSPDESRRQQMTLLVPGSGLELPVEVVSGKIFNERGEPLAIVSVLHDLTEQAENERLYQELKTFSSQLERRVREATADLEEQNARLQWQSQELEKANRLKSQFLASMSHELRTPINALIGYTSLLLDRIYGDINEQQFDVLTRVQIAAQHLLALINDILDLAKIEAGRMPLHLEEVQLGDLIAEITAQIEPLVSKKGLEYGVFITPEVPAMVTDRLKVRQILLNLLSNAIKFTHDGSVSVRARRRGEMVDISVEDTGIGIRDEYRDSIWEDFRQVDQSITREFGGTGLGLSITRRLVEALGGEVSVASEFTKGSTFTVSLPVRSVQTETEPGTAHRGAPGGRGWMDPDTGEFAPPSPS